jgi:MOSC domain-containing protein YiiM
MDREWTTGFFKTPCHGPRHVTANGVEGDGQADLVNHGGPDKAVCVYPAEHYPEWRRSLGLELPWGAFGENLTVEGLLEHEVHIGQVFACGALRLQVSQPRQPCWKLARRWRVKDLAAQVERTGRTGWYFRVLQEGALAADDMLGAVSMGTKWTVAAANDIMHHRKEDWQAASDLAACEELSRSWRQSLLRRAEMREVPSSEARLGNT